ncbi:MAG TPA: hypothetical protein GXX55_05250 [Firmicutes bacterium]|nr:hypothetical protein [Bacillota bacterium]
MGPHDEVSLLWLLVGLLGILVVALVLSTLSLALRIRKLRSRESIVPFRLQQRYRRLVELTLFVVGGIGIGLGVAFLLR